MSVLVIDIGSSSTRAILFDGMLQIIATSSHPYRFRHEPAGAAIVHAHELQKWVENCIDEVFVHPMAQDIRVVGMATFVGNILGLDQAGQAITPVYTYADTRSAPDVEILRQQVDVRAVHQRTGCRLHTAYHPSRLQWLKSQNTENVTRWTDIGTYLYQRWFGRDVPCSYSLAAWSGLLNRAALSWDAEWLSILNISSDQLPPLADYDTVECGTTSHYAQRWPSLRDVPFCLGVGDGAAANVGSGTVNDGQIALTVGTTGAIRKISTDTLPSVPEGLWSYRVTANHHLIGGATSEGGNIFQWLKQTIQLPDQLDERLLEKTPNVHGLTFLPLLAGERSPGWNANTTGAIHGLRLSTSSLDIVQAALEGVALRLALIAEQIAPKLDDTIFAGGGALNASRAWTQMIADALNHPLQFIDDDEVTARGAAILALKAIGACKLEDFPPTISEVIEPRGDFVPVMREARERQKELYRKLGYQL